MEFEDLKVEVSKKTMWITFNRPHVLNALRQRTIIEILSALESCTQDPSIVAVVFTGTGRAFCAGMDLKEIAKDVESGDIYKRRSFTALADKMFLAIEHLPRVTIAMINGICVAGGLELALCCDLIIASEDAQIGDLHIRNATVPNGGASVRLPRQIGARRAKELLFTGEIITGKKAMEIGLINYAVPLNQLRNSVEELLEKIVEKSPLALQAMKMLVNYGLRCDVEAGLQFEHQVVEFLENSPAFKEALNKFKFKS